ncbi:MAG: fumarylacetoacetate hydrolase family protein [Deltaproteobacteria bacterium]|jgi:2-keto-4-pentenoate hydratase/2-oxohepta-3-ene-1,7-dioic acid hydratase in catechol pathway|nr:fumarylacetoacetate hydrolase family protein [Deltaproteobacteria bacterium]
MNFLMYETGTAVGVAVNDGVSFRGLSELDPDYPGDLETLLAKGADLLAIGHDLKKKPILDLRQAKLRPPIARPEKILCVGLNYQAHVDEAFRREATGFPEVFARFANTLIGCGDPIVKPASSSKVDFEGELAVVIGRGGKNIPKGVALNHVAGYSIFNDVSMRDYQFRGSQWTLGKNFDSSGPFGPWLVTPDDLPPGASGLAITTRLNGRVMQSANTGDVIFDVASLIEYLSSAMTLKPGDVIITGTPGGVGMSRTPQVFMRPGDHCEVEIDGLGLLRNHVTEEAPIKQFA